MMFGFGDDRQPLVETVTLMEQLVTGYVTELTHRALEAGSKRGKVQIEDLVCALRRVRSFFHLCALCIMPMRYFYKYIFRCRTHESKGECVSC